MTKRNRSLQMPANSCIFKDCSDASAHTGISKEHLWSDWLAPLLPLGREHSSHAHIKTGFNNIHQGVFEIKPSWSMHRGPPNSRKLRIVCAKCNGGWMSEIETAVKKVMTELIQGECAVITVDQQMALCQWIMLKSIIGEYTDRSTMAISESDRMYLKNQRSVPPGWKIWIGNFLGSEKEWLQKYSHTGCKIGIVGEPVPPFINGQTTTIVINELFMHAASMPQSSLVKWMPSHALMQIWPPNAQDIQWPPKLPISDEEASTIAYRMFDQSFLTSRAKVAVINLESSDWVDGKPEPIDKP